MENNEKLKKVNLNQDEIPIVYEDNDGNPVVDSKEIDSILKKVNDGEDSETDGLADLNTEIERLNGLIEKLRAEMDSKRDSIAKIREELKKQQIELRKLHTSRHNKKNQYDREAEASIIEVLSKIAKKLSDMNLS